MLNDAERRATAAQLAANLELSGLTVEQLAGRVGRPAAAVVAALAVPADGDPVLVWALRDALDVAVRDAGAHPVPYSVLTESARVKARGWFGI